MRPTNLRSDKTDRIQETVEDTNRIVRDKLEGGE